MRFLVGLLAAVALVTVGCGSDEAERASANTDASALLRSTVQNLSGLKSANVDLKLTAREGSAQLAGPFAAAEEKGELPRFALTATMKSGARTQTAGATWTGEKGYATLDGVSYEIPSLFAQQLGAGFEQASPLTTLDVSKWVSNPRNAGLADVGGVQTVKITGGANVAAVLADVERLGASLGSLQGLLGGKPFALTPTDRKRAVDAVKDGKVELYTGAADSKLRRLVVNATIDGERVVLDLTLTNVDEDVSIAEPSGAKPFSELMQKFQAHGGLKIK